MEQKWLESEKSRERKIDPKPRLKFGSRDLEVENEF